MLEDGWPAGDPKFPTWLRGFGIGMALTAVLFALFEGGADVAAAFGTACILASYALQQAWNVAGRHEPDPSEINSGSGANASD